MSTCAIPEIVRLIDDHKIVVTPVQAIKVEAIGKAAWTRKVSVEKDVIIQAVRRNRIIDIVILIGIPVFR